MVWYAGNEGTWVYPRSFAGFLGSCFFGTDMSMHGGEDAAPAYIFEMMMKMVKKIMMTRCNGSSNSTSEIMASKRQVCLTFPNYSSFCWWNTTKQTYWGYGILIAHSSTAVSLTHTFRSFCDCSSVDNWNANEELSLVLYPIVFTFPEDGPGVYILKRPGWKWKRNTFES